MISWMRPRPAPWRKALAACAAAAGAIAFTADVRPALAQSAFSLYLERTAMLAAGERCHLFDPALTSALTAAQAQARTAALRAGSTPEALNKGANDARAQVAPMVCVSAHVQQAAARARAAFKAWSGLQRMAFPGDVGTWRADRFMPLKSAAWRLSQDAIAGQDKVVFGIAGQDGREALTLAVTPADGPDPYAARLVLRDPARLSQPLSTKAHDPLSARAPLSAAAKVVLAETRDEADPALRPRGSNRAVAFRFPASAEAALAGLDPREAIAVELLYPSSRGDVVHTAFIEVGDFDAGLAFLKSGFTR